MECRICVENLTAYLDAELSPAESSQVSAHMRTCSSCRQEYESLLSAQQLIDNNLSEMELQPAPWRRIESEIRSTERPRTGLFSWRPFFATPLRSSLASAAALVLLVALVVLSAYMALNSSATDPFVQQSLEAYVQEVEAAERDHGDLFAAEDRFFRHNPFAEEDLHHYSHNPFREGF